MSKIITLFILLNISAFSSIYSQSEVFYKNGLSKQSAGLHDNAIVEFTKAIIGNEAAVQKYLVKWNDFQKNSKFENAEKNIEAPPVDIALAKPYYHRGVSYAALKMKEEAIQDFTTAININQKFAKSFYERGRLLWDSGKKYEGCSDLSSAKSLGDTLSVDLFDNKFCWSEAVTYYKNAQSSIKLKQYSKAFDLITKSIQLSPDSAVYYGVRGMCYLGMEKLDLAFRDFDKAIAGSPNNIEALFGRGVAYYTKRKYQESFDDLNKAIQLDSKFSDAYLYRAYSCEGMNKVASAIYDYQQVQKLNPRDPIAYYRSGLLKNDNSNPKGACADFKKAAALGSAEAADYANGCDK